MAEIKKKRIEFIDVYDKTKTVQEKRAYYEQLTGDVTAKEEEIKAAKEAIEVANKDLEKARRLEAEYASKVEAEDDAKRKKVLKSMESKKIEATYLTLEGVEAKQTELSELESSLLMLKSQVQDYESGLSHIENEDKPLSRTARVNMAYDSGKSRTVPTPITPNSPDTENNVPSNGGDEPSDEGDTPVTLIPDLTSDDEHSESDNADKTSKDSDEKSKDADVTTHTDEGESSGYEAEEADKTNEVDESEAKTLNFDINGDYFDSYDITDEDKQLAEKTAKYPFKDKTWRAAQASARSKDATKPESDFDRFKAELEANKKAIATCDEIITVDSSHIDAELECLNTEFSAEETNSWKSGEYADYKLEGLSKEELAALAEDKETYDTIDEMVSFVNEYKRAIYEAQKSKLMFEARDKILEEKIAALSADKSVDKSNDSDEESKDSSDKSKESKESAAKGAERTGEPVVSNTPEPPKSHETDEAEPIESKDIPASPKARKTKGKIDPEKESPKMEDTKSRDELVSAFDDSVESAERSEGFKAKMAKIGTAIGTSVAAGYKTFKDKVAIPVKNKAVEFGKSVSYGYSYYKETNLRFKEDRQNKELAALSEKRKTMDPSSVVKETLEARELKASVASAEDAVKPTFKERMGTFVKDCGVKLSAAKDWAAVRLQEKGKSLAVGYDAFKEQKGTFDLANTRACLAKSAEINSNSVIEGKVEKSTDAVTPTQKMEACADASVKGKEGLDSYIAGIKDLLDSYDKSEKTDADKKMVFDNLSKAVEGSKKFREVPVVEGADVETDLEAGI